MLRGIAGRTHCIIQCFHDHASTLIHDQCAERVAAILAGTASKLYRASQKIFILWR
jgi:hypothetical protein